MHKSSMLKARKPGHGLVFYGDTILPFEDEFPEDTLMFQLLNTDPTKRKKALKPPKEKTK